MILWASDSTIYIKFFFKTQSRPRKKIIAKINQDQTNRNKKVQ